MPDIPEVMASPTTHKVGSRSYEIRPLTFQDFGVLMRKALDEYKRTLMSGLMSCADLIPVEKREAELRTERQRILRLDHLDLPTKTFMLDEADEVTDDAAACKENVKVDYWRWWAGNTYEGRVHSVWLGLRKAQPDVTLDFVEQNIMGSNLTELANLIGDLSKATLGNAEAAAA